MLYKDGVYQIVITRSYNYVLIRDYKKDMLADEHRISRIYSTVYLIETVKEKMVQNTILHPNLLCFSLFIFKYLRGAAEMFPSVAKIYFPASFTI